MSEIYSSRERAIIFLVTAAVSLVASCIYLFCRIDYKRTSLLVFIVCLIYSSLFVNLNLLAMFDSCFGNAAGFEKFSKIISIFYDKFSIADKAFGFVIFNLWIYYLESGYYHIHRKLFDLFERKWNSIKKQGACKIIAKACIEVPIFGAILVVLIIDRDRYNLSSNPIDYIEALMDCYGIFQIYSSVGFFLIQIFIDCKRKKNKVKIERYYRYSIIKIIEKTESYIKKMKDSLEVLDEAVKKLDNNNLSKYDNYLKDTLKEIQKQINVYEIEGNKQILDSDNQINNMNNMYNINNMNNMYNMNNMNNVNNMNNMYNMNNMNNMHNFNNMNNMYNFNNMHNFNNMNNIYNNNETIEYNNNGNIYPNYISNNVNSNEMYCLKSNQNKPVIYERQYYENNEYQTQNKEEKKEEKEIKNDIPTSIRKYKKSARRIIKLKKLYKEIRKEKKTDLNEVNNKFCSCRCII